MKKYKYLTYILRAIISAIFWLMCFFSMLGIITDIFTDNGEIEGYFHASSHNIGYKIPVRLYISEPDSVMHYKNDVIHSSAALFYKNNSNYGDEEFIEKLKNKAGTEVLVSKTQITLSESPYANNENVDKLQFRPEIEAKGTIIANSKDRMTKILLIIYAYSSLIALLCIFYQLKNIFSLLHASLSFSIKLISRIKYLGYIILLYQGINHLTLMRLKGNFWNLDFRTLENGMLADTHSDIRIELCYNLNFTLLLIGLSLIILSALLKLGNQYEQESKLTI